MKDYAELTNIISNLELGDDLRVNSHNNIKLKKHRTNEIINIKSPFTTVQQYEKYINNCFGEFKYSLISTADISKGLHIVCLHKDTTITGEHSIFIRQLRPETKLVSA